MKGRFLPNVGQLVVHVPHVVFDVNCDAWRLQHLHGELLRKGTNKQSSDCVDAGDLIRHADLFGLVPVLQVEHTCRQKDRKITINPLVVKQTDSEVNLH